MTEEIRPPSSCTIDPVCIVHGKRMSEHACLYCCLCFKSMEPADCNVRADGEKEDVCRDCAAAETLQQGRCVLRRISDGKYLEVFGWEIEWGDKPSSLCPVFTAENMDFEDPHPSEGNFHRNLWRKFSGREADRAGMLCRMEVLPP